MPIDFLFKISHFWNFWKLHDGSFTQRKFHGIFHLLSAGPEITLGQGRSFTFVNFTFTCKAGGWKQPPNTEATAWAQCTSLGQGGSLEYYAWELLENESTSNKYTTAVCNTKVHSYTKSQYCSWRHTHAHLKLGKYKAVLNSDFAMTQANTNTNRILSTALVKWHDRVCRAWAWLWQNIVSEDLSHKVMQLHKPTCTVD